MSCAWNIFGVPNFSACIPKLVPSASVVTSAPETEVTTYIYIYLSIYLYWLEIFEMVYRLRIFWCASSALLSGHSGSQIITVSVQADLPRTQVGAMLFQQPGTEVNGEWRSDEICVLKWSLFLYYTICPRCGPGFHLGVCSATIESHAVARL